ncbi:Cruciform DNA binding protein [Aspergillus tubingensis]
MGSYTFTWPYNANEVFVTGTFDDWGKTVKLDRVGDVFEKEVPLPVTDEKVHYKFVVDGIWTTDNRAPEEDDGSSNINNVLYPDQILKESTTPLLNGTAEMAGVTPGSTTAALAAGVPKESSSKQGQNGYYPTISSAAPGSTTAALGQDVPLEQRANVPGSYPITPASEADKFSVNPIPASSGAGNPIKLNPGEKVPDPSTFNANTISSTARTDRAGYEQGTSGGFPGSPAYDASAFAIPPVSKNMIPESSLPMGESQGATEPSYTIQSAAPTSTTAGLAAAVPLESQRQTGGRVPTRDVPDVVRQSLSEAHRDPEAATSKEAVDEKKEMEEELRRKVPVDNSTGAPAPTTVAGLGTSSGLGFTAGAAPSTNLGPSTGLDVATGMGTTTGLGAVAGATAAQGSQKETTSGLPAHDVPDVVKQSISEAHRDPEAAGVEEAVGEKREVEEELQQKVPVSNQSGTPAPVITAATSERAPGASGAEPASESAPRATGAESASAQVSPRATTPTDGPTVTTGVATSKAPEESGPGASGREDTTEIPTKPAAGATGASATKTVDSGVESGIAPDETTPAPTAGATGASATKTADPTETSGAPTSGTSKLAESAPTSNAAATSKPATNNAAGATTNGKEEKKKKKGFFSRLKEKLKSV